MMQIFGVVKVGDRHGEYIIQRDSTWYQEEEDARAVVDSLNDEVIARAKNDHARRVLSAEQAHKEHWILVDAGARVDYGKDREFKYPAFNPKGRMQYFVEIAEVQ